MKSITTKLALASLIAGASLFATPTTLDVPHSHIGFAVKHLLISNTRGKFQEYSGAIDFDFKKKTFNSLSSIIKTASINTENKKRDKHLRSGDFFDSEKYPNIKFMMTSYKKTAEDEGVMTGDLTMKGITHSVKLDVEELGTQVFKGKNRVGFTLEGKIDRTKFGLTWNKALETGGFVVGEKVKLSIDLEAIEK